MIKTAIFLYPTDKGNTDISYHYAQEYSRICLSVLPRNRQHLIVVNQDTKLLHEGIDQIQPNIPVSQKDRIANLIEATKSLSSQNSQTANVARLILVGDPGALKIPQNQEQAISIASEVSKLLPKFFQKFLFEMVVFIKGTAHEEVFSNEDESIKVSLVNEENVKIFAQLSVYNHLKLSSFKMSRFHIYFLDIFNQSQIVVTNVLYHSPEDLLGQVVTSYPCVILDETTPVLKELELNVILFDNKYLLSLSNGKCFLSVIEKYTPQYLDTIKDCYFTINNPNQNFVLQSMVPKLLLEPNDKHFWAFQRTELPPPALRILTELNILADPEYFIFKPEFWAKPMVQRFLGPILSIVAKSNPTDQDVRRLYADIQTLMMNMMKFPHEFFANLTPPGAQSYESTIKSFNVQLKFIFSSFKKETHFHDQMFNIYNQLGDQILVRQLGK